MIRTLITFAALAFLGRGYLEHAGIPVDAIFGYAYESVGAAFEWNRYDFTAMGTVLALAAYTWMRRPRWARFIQRRRQRRMDEAYLRATDPLDQYDEKAYSAAQAIMDQIDKAMRKGQRSLEVKFRDRVIRQHVQRMGRDRWGARFEVYTPWPGDHPQEFSVRWDRIPDAKDDPDFEVKGDPRRDPAGKSPFA